MKGFSEQGRKGVPSVSRLRQGAVNLKRVQQVDDWLRRGCEGLAPLRCLFCDQPTPGHRICPPCSTELPWNACACPGCARPMPEPVPCSACNTAPRAFDSAFAALRFESPARETIHALKYGARLDRARLLAELMGTLLALRAEPLPGLLIPMPLHRWRLVKRGFNQATEIARELGRRLHLEVDRGCARRLRATADQIGLDSVSRRRNVRGAFAIERDLSGTQVALIDDVMTTGASLEELARAARRAGAARIEVWCAARVG